MAIENDTGRRFRTAIVYTKECAGYHVFELFATDFDCDALAHAGAVRNYVFYRTSEDGC